MDFFISFTVKLDDYVQNQILRFKNLFFDGYYIKLGFYDKTTKRINWLYDYDNILYLLFESYVFKSVIIPYGKESITSHDHVLIGSYMKNGKQLYEFRELSSSDNELSDIKVNFLYCVLANYYDVTREFEHLKISIMNNKSLTCEDILLMVNMCFHKKLQVNNNVELKIAMDDSFDEITFKSNETLILHDGIKRNIFK